jgi:hypothetical protein
MMNYFSPMAIKFLLLSITLTVFFVTDLVRMTHLEKS